ncbi:capsule assembly Wzi family protein [Rudanella lutea]|uniref:capsule assembly Wzi family protein n=1 Tax=Rudanella lutea TaxID=451374 RepID=UPI00037D001A|nr:capsule assembly Wzi family protein [Rudanella lutea]
MKRLFFGGLTAIAALTPSLAQQIPDTTQRGQRVFAEAGGLVASGSSTPFWLRSRQYGIVPLNAPAGLVRVGGVQFLGDPDNSKQVHLKLGLEAVGTAAPGAARVMLPEAYASARLGAFELYVGKRREVFGLGDTLLTSGSYAWSGNAMPIPKLQIGTRGFVPIGFTKGILAVSALYAHGWFSNTDSVQGSFLHQKALFGRISLFRNRVRLFGGVTHHAQWGGRSEAVGKLAPGGRLPSSLRDYWRVITVDQPPASDSAQYSQFDLLNRVGNHLGSIDLALELAGSRANWYLYYQHPFEDKSGVAMQNMPDGLYGLRWRNATPEIGSGFRLQQVTAELLTTMNQGGFTIDTKNRQYDGADDYFNNYQYRDGWTHQQRVLGTPFLTRYLDTRPDLRDLRGGFGRMMISNNRVQVLHLGLLGGWPSGVQVRALVSHSRNFGRPIWHDPRTPRTQLSGMAEVLVPVRWGTQSQVRLTLAADEGRWLNNSLGAMLSFRTLLSQR